jgi:competence protein ComEA
VTDIPRTTPRDEHAFWDDRFRDERRTARPRRGVAQPPRHDQGRPVVADGPYARVLDRLVDRLREWREDARFGVAVLVLIAVVAGVVWYRIGVGGASAGETPAPLARRTNTTTTRATPSDSTLGSVPATAKGPPTKLAVHVAGSVVHPGVVEVAAGSRVIDALEAVGGALPGADLDRLNLAAKVADGQRVYVAKPGEADPGVADGTDPSAVGAPGGVGAPAGKVNLNTASQAQLEALPGIGPSFAQSIIAERQRRGGFHSVNDLRSVHGIGDKRFAELAPLVTV